MNKYKVWSPYGRAKLTVTSIVGFYIISGEAIQR
jgi:hypothetical protein